MNYFKKLSKGLKGKDRVKNLVISIVILIEVIAILMVASFAWVETVSSIKISNKDDEATIDTYVFTRAMIGGTTGTIDLGKYFRQAGDMHLSPASSADGKNFYFPQNAANTTSYTNAYRKGNINDKNTLYMSVSFRVKADTNADFFFTGVPTFTNLGSDIRVSVTAYTEGDSPEGHYDPDSGTTVSNTKIYALNSSSTAVVNSTTGSTGTAAVEAFSDHDIEGRTSSGRLFSVGAEETKIVTVNLWLQGSSMSSNISTLVNISNFGLKSDLTPRHVTLIPTPTWDKTNITEYFYAWCFMSDDSVVSRLYKLELDENEHYSFDYNGKYDKTLFIRSGTANLTKDYLSSHWNDNTVWNKTEDTTIPVSPVDPTYIIMTENGSTQHDDSHDSPNYDNDAKKSTGEWSNPVKINIAYTTDPSGQNTWGDISAATYIGNSTSTNVMEQTNNDNASAKHHRTIHGWTGKRLKLSATPKTVSGNAVYDFVGWYSDAAGTTRISSNANHDFNISAAAGTEVTYYAKFKQVRKITLKKYLDGSSSSTNVGTYKIDTDKSGTTQTSIDKTVDYGSQVTLSASPITGYSVQGFYNVESGGTALSPVTTSGSTKSVTITANSANYNTDYYVRYTSNEHTVTANAYYSTNNGSSYSAGASGGTVKVGNSSSGATSAATVKYKHTVTLTATPSTGYEFVGWYDAATGGSQLSTAQTHTYTLNSDNDVNVYARFKYAMFNVTARACYTDDGSNYTVNDSTGGTVKAGTSAADATSSDLVKHNYSISLKADPATGYEFHGWYTASTGGTQLSTSTSYDYTLSGYADVDVYARFVKTTWEIKYGVHGESNWSSEAMTSSGDTVTGSLTLTEGQDFSFKICGTVGSTTTWYGANNASYSDITSTNFITNLTLSTSGDDVYMKGHAGEYTFTFNKSTNVLNVTASYSDITIEMWDDTDGSWIGDDNAVVYFVADEGANVAMTKDDRHYTVSVPSNNCTNAKFERKVGSTVYNTFNNGNRGYKTGFSARQINSNSYWY